MASLTKALSLSFSPHQTTGLMTCICDNNSIRRKNKDENCRNRITTIKKTRNHGNKCSERYSNLVLCSQMRTTLTTASFKMTAISPKQIESLFLTSTPVAFGAIAAATSTLKKKAEKFRISATSNRPKTQQKERNPKLLRNTTPPLNKLDLYQIMKYPLTTESAIKCVSDDNTLVFIVDIKADKKMIRTAINMMFDIQTQKVNTSIRPDGTKKAFVKLAPQHNASDVANKIGIF